LLVVIGIIALLIAILLPALSRARIQANRTKDLSNIRQVALACVTYAAQNKGVWPLGARTGTDLVDPANDDLVWINSYTFGYFLSFLDNQAVASGWLSTTTQYPNGVPLTPNVQRSLACTSLFDNEFALASQVGYPYYRYYSVNYTETYMGFIYWANRNSAVSGSVYDQNGNAVTSIPLYQFPQKQGGTATSQVLVSCPAYVGPTYGYEFPHYTTTDTFSDNGNSNGALNGPNAQISKSMNGICCAYTDGSAKWVPRKQLWSMYEGNFEWIYFDKTNP